MNKNSRVRFQSGLRITWGRLVFAAILILGLVAIARAQQANDTEPGEVQARGPVHEAFAEAIDPDPQAGVIVDKAPPALIEEIPPAQKPAGADVIWIPGYWSWDDERNDFLWISGIWRSVPPGRTWIAGVWEPSGKGYQWISGYWREEGAEVHYLPEPPPATLEAGPNIPAPSDDQVWVPGTWVYRETHYSWSPGYWEVGRPDWIYVPPHYVWTPRGHVWVGGYWDYVVEDRGVMFAPVYFEHRYPVRYSPTVVISLDVFGDSLFIRRGHGHYYYGDYYDPGYERSGFFAVFSFGSRRRGYDPIYAHQRWQHRGDRDWGNRNRQNFQQRRDNAGARPARTFAAQQQGGGANGGRGPVAAPFNPQASRPRPAQAAPPVSRPLAPQVPAGAQTVAGSTTRSRPVTPSTVGTIPERPSSNRRSSSDNGSTDPRTARSNRPITTSRPKDSTISGSMDRNTQAATPLTTGQRPASTGAAQTVVPQAPRSTTGTPSRSRPVYETPASRPSSPSVRPSSETSRPSTQQYVPRNSANPGSSNPSTTGYYPRPQTTRQQPPAAAASVPMRTSQVPAAVKGQGFSSQSQSPVLSGQTGGTISRPVSRPSVRPQAPAVVGAQTVEKPAARRPSQKQ